MMCASFRLSAVLYIGLQLGAHFRYAFNVQRTMRPAAAWLGLWVVLLLVKFSTGNWEAVRLQGGRPIVVILGLSVIGHRYPRQYLQLKT